MHCLSRGLARLWGARTARRPGERPPGRPAQDLPSTEVRRLRERPREVGMRASRQPAPVRQCRNRSGNGLQELLLHMVQTLVDVPGLVTVNAAEGRHTVVLEVRMAPTDVGKVIGKQGRIAGAL